MKNSNKYPLIAFISLILCMITLISCSNASGGDKAFYPEEEIKEEAPESAADIDPDNTSITSERKLIRTITMTIQTKNFDGLLSDVNRSIGECGGYVESSRAEGNADSKGDRYAYIVARIPKDKTDEFISGVSNETNNIVSKEENTKDVTMAYVDTESRLSSLRAQRAALEALYEKAVSVEEIAYVQKELSAVISDIEAYEATLREYENLVSYSTITLNIDEVEVYTEVDKSYGEEIYEGFSESLKNVGIFFRNLSIFIIVNIPYFLMLGIPVAAIIIFVIMRKRKKKAGRQNK